MNPKMDEEALKAVLSALQAGEPTLIATHVNPDGDGIGAALGVAYALRKWGKEAVLCCESPIPSRYDFLEGIEAFHTPDQLVGRSFTRLVTVDCGDWERIGKVASLYRPGLLINIDHHETNTQFGTINWVRPQAAATSEMVAELLKKGGLSFERGVATALFTGISVDTGSFHYSNTTPQTMRQAADLLEKGVEPDVVSDRLFDTYTIPQFQLMRRAFDAMQIELEARTAWVAISLEMLSACGASQDDVEGLVNYARGIEGVEVGLLFREVSSKEVKISLRSRKWVNVAEIAASFGGGGHERAAGATLALPLSEAIDPVLSVVRTKVAEAFAEKAR